MRKLLFEFEDLPWFPAFLRNPATGILELGHRIQGFGRTIAPLIERAAKASDQETIVDLCSGAGGPMPACLEHLSNKNKSFSLILTDLYPNTHAISKFNKSKNISYQKNPVNATELPKDLKGIRTLMTSFHHLPPNIAKNVLHDAQRNGAPIVVVEPFARNVQGFFMILPAVLVPFFLIPFVKPRTISNFVFTYIIPLIPLLLFWDGWVSYLRVYSQKEIKKMLTSLPEDTGYQWEYGFLENGRCPYILGVPLKTGETKNV